MFLDRLVSFFTSIKLTVVLLVLALVLVFIGTLAQVELGLYEVQSRFFQSFFAMWGPAGASWKIPVFPGGYLIGGLLLLNLVCSLIKIGFNPKKSGIIVIHIGLMLLLVGQLATDKLASEGMMHLRLNETRSYSESDRRHELTITDSSDPAHANVVAIPDSRLATGDTLDVGLPFRLKVRQFMPNSALARQEVSGFSKSPATAGTGQGLWYREEPAVTKMDERDIPSVIVDLETPAGQELGTYLLSRYFDRPEHVDAGGKHFDLALRLRRYYKPFSLHLLEFRHDVYKGTTIPKNFSSLVRLDNPDNGEKREVKIYMNNPLRYGGYTFYQSGFDPDNQGSTLQVVRNPGWLAPYFGCLIVGGGLLLQFLTHLIPFLKRKL
jgi:hypothetical protein